MLVEDSFNKVPQLNHSAQTQVHVKEWINCVAYDHAYAT